MREPATAELILSLVMAPDRAASTLGDLLEERQTGGRARFWRSIASTFAAAFLRDLIADPLTKVRLALWAWLNSAWCGALTYFVLYYVLPQVPAGPHASDTTPWTPRITLFLQCTVIALLIGWGVGKASQSRELATGLAAALLLPAALVRVPHVTSPEEFLVTTPFVLAGAILYRFSKPSQSPRALPPARP